MLLGLLVLSVITRKESRQQTASQNLIFYSNKLILNLMSQLVDNH